MMASSTSASLFGQQFAWDLCASYLRHLTCVRLLREQRVLVAKYASCLQFKAAQFLRLAESKGNKTLGNTW